MGKERYYAALKHASAVIGNSSSGLVEAPSFHIPTLNIGNRQKGRTRGDSVVDCEASYESVSKSLHYALSSEMKCKVKNASNPYFKPGTLNAIFEVVAQYPLNTLVYKSFYNI